MKATLSACALALGMISAGAVSAAQAQDAQQAGLTRTQVQQDLADWRAAGMSEQTVINGISDPRTHAYQQALAKYQELRQARISK